MARAPRVRIEVLFPAERVRERIAELAAAVSRDYAEALPEIVSIERGAERFTQALVAELGRRGARPAVHRVRVRRTQGTALREVQVDAFEPERFEARDVLVVDDVADAGDTLRAVCELLAAGEPRSLRTAVLVDKREMRAAPLALDYAGFRVERGWVVGFGMDLAGAYRELDFIGVAVDPRF